MNNKKIFIIIGVIIAVIATIITVILVFNKKESITYNISFETNGGSTVKEQIVNKGEQAKKPIDPKKEGYIFIEWLINGKTYDFSLPVNSDIVLTAKWEEKLKDIETFVVKFNSDGGTTIPNQIIEKGSKVTKPEVPKKEGYKFLGWILNEKEYDFETLVESNIELKAKWEKVEEKTTNNNTNKNNTTNNNTNKNNTTNNNTNKTNTTNNNTNTTNTTNNNTNKNNTTNSGSTNTGNNTTSGTEKPGTNNPPNDENESNNESTTQTLETPRFTEEFVSREVSGLIYKFYIKTNDEISGWQVYMTSNKQSGFIEIEGEGGYHLHKDIRGEFSFKEMLYYGENYKFRARVYKDTANGRVYSGWSDLIKLSQ